MSQLAVRVQVLLASGFVAMQLLAEDVELVRPSPVGSAESVRESEAAPHIRRMLRSSVFVEGHEEGRGVIVTAEGLVVTAAHVVLAPDAINTPVSVKVILEGEVLQEPGPTVGDRTFGYRTLGSAFPSDVDFVDQLILLEPEEVVPFDRAQESEFWAWLVGPDKNGEGQCEPLPLHPVSIRPQREDVPVRSQLAILGPSPDGPGKVTLARAELRTEHSFVEVTPDCFPERSLAPFFDNELRYQCRACGDGWSGAPVFDFAGRLWGLHVRRDQGQWAFSIASQFDRVVSVKAAEESARGEVLE